MTIDRWNPFREMVALREMMDRLFEENVARTGLALGGAGRAMSFPVDLVEQDEGFVLYAALPGVKPEDVQVTINGDTLTFRGELREQEERSGQNWLLRERRSGQFHRMISLPAPVDPDRATASFRDGILELRLPKAAAARPRQIPVRSQSSPAQLGQTAQSSQSGQGTVGTQPGQPGQPATQPAPAPPPTTAREHDDEDKVTQESAASFPTSDAPSWTPERT
jgi:HSP20 family protein